MVDTMETFDEDGNRTYETQQEFTVSADDAGKIVRHLTEGEALVSYDGRAGELSEEMPADEAAQYWSDARNTELEGSYDGELPNPDEMNEHFDQYLGSGDGQLARIAPAEVMVHFDEPGADEEHGMAYILETTVEHGEETANLSVTSTRTLGQSSNPGEVSELADRLDGETAEAFETVYDNVDW